MADGRHFEKVFRYNSVENHPISTKFGMQMQILVPITATSQNIKILQIQYGGQPPYWKSFFGYISTIYCPIDAKFDKKKQDHVRHSPWPKCKISKIQDGGRPPFWKWFNRYISVVDPFSMRFGVLTQILALKTVTWQSIKIFKLKMAGGRHIENRLWLHLNGLLCD